MIGTKELKEAEGRVIAIAGEHMDGMDVVEHYGIEKDAVDRFAAHFTARTMADITFKAKKPEQAIALLFVVGFLLGLETARCEESAKS